VDRNQTADVTTLLLAWNRGDPQALDQLMPVVYNELRRLARRHMRSENPGHTLQATALVNDLYVHLIDQKRVNWQKWGPLFRSRSAEYRKNKRAGARKASRQPLKRRARSIRERIHVVTQPISVPWNLWLQIRQILRKLLEILIRRSVC
jgi:hypothetical protein